MKIILLATCYLLITTCLQAQLNTPKNTFTKADTLRGSNNENRDWWDVLYYDITVKPDFEKKEIEGKVVVIYKYLIDIEKDGSLEPEEYGMQIDLQYPLMYDSIFLGSNKNWYRRRFLPEDTIELIKNYNPDKPHNFTFNFGRDTTIGKNFYLFRRKKVTTYKKGDIDSITIFYHGKPREAKKAPWDGGWVWAKDKLGRPFVSVACQGLGASSWFPCKDYQGDEPDSGSSLTIVVPDSLVAVGNGIRNWELGNQNNTTIQQTNPKLQTPNSFTWQVKNPINTYCIVPYIGNYINFTDSFNGEKGTLDLSYWVLDYNKEKAQEQFKQVKPMLKAFEYWFGPYPFYEDGYKLVEAPYLGMEHQSAIAYGNGFQNGYKGRDLSGSGWGLKWDFIIVHESGHEWFANSITTKDIADMWVHEGFTNYSEVLFTEYYYGKEAANDYCYGLRKNIVNDVPIIGPYGVNKEGSGDMYWKAANMIHSIRNALNDDKKFRKILRGMNEKFYHKTVDGVEIEQYLIEQTGLDLQKIFDQYLTTTQIPQLDYYFKGKKLFYKYSNCIDGFNMPITIPITNKKIIPTTEWQHKRIRKKNKEWFTVKNIERLYLLKVKNIEPLSSPILQAN